MPTLFIKKLTAYFFISVCISLGVYTIAYAETEAIDESVTEPKEKRPGQYRTFLVYFENDLFADTDQHYTNAVKFYLAHQGSP